MKKQYKSWSKKSEAVSKIIQQFDLHRSTNGAAGINADALETPADIKEKVYYHPQLKADLEQYNPNYFVAHCRKIINEWNLAKAKERARKSKKKLIFKLCFILFLNYSHYFYLSSNK